MKITSQREKWLSAVLGVVCLLLLVNLMLRWGGLRAKAFRSPGLAERTGGMSNPPTSVPPGREELSGTEPVVQLDVLKTLQSRPLPRLARNPFEIEAPRSAASPAAPGPASAPQPPSPPPIPLKALGHSQNIKGQQEAFLTDEEQVYVVHEGETFAKKYKVVKITSKFVEVQDEASLQRVELPFPY